MFCELNSKSPYTGELESIWCSGRFFCDSVETKNYYCRVQMCNLHCFDIVEPDELIEQFAEIDDGIADLFLNDASPSTKQLAMAIRASTVSLKFWPVFLSSAVQPLLDGVRLCVPCEPFRASSRRSRSQVDLVPVSRHYSLLRRSDSKGAVSDD
jgi:translation elongation factor EF-G